MSALNGCYGARVNGHRLFELLGTVLEANIGYESDTGKRPTPICIWGTHGLGKTEIAMEVARSRGWKIAYCAPAQFEEMGDLHGLPFKVDPDPNMIGDERTVYLPPDWVPTDEGPGILLLDDINRADDRILRGTMQLLQNFEMFSWALPPRWQIVVTANPDSGDYSVTPMDEAMLTRMIHVTLTFDEKAWAEWALKAGVDERGVNFVLTYPEMVTMCRTTPRTLVQFFSQIKRIPDLIQEKKLVEILANGCLDKETANSFMNFLEDSLHKLPSPEEFLDQTDEHKIHEQLKVLLHSEKGVRLDLVNTLMSRIVMKLKSEYQPSPNAELVLKYILKSELIPVDLRFAFHADLGSAFKELSPSSKIMKSAVMDLEIASQFVKLT